MIRLLIIATLVAQPLVARPIDELRRLQDRGFSWQVYISSRNDEPIVCVLLSKQGKNTEGCADSISRAIVVAERKLRSNG